MTKTRQKQDIEWHDENGFVCGLPAEEGCICPICNSGEVNYPAQTMDAPAIIWCLNCNYHAAHKEFKIND